MSHRRTALLAAATLACGTPVALSAIAAPPTCGSQLAPPKLSFGDRVVIDPQRPGGEPVAVVAQDGSISVSAHGGTTHLYKDPAALATSAADLTSTYTNQTLNWRSNDNGKTWSYVGLAGGRTGPHTATSTGFSDPDFAMDAGGRIYNTEIDLANVAVFSSGDDGQTYSRGVAEVTSGDRPWLTAGRKDEVYLYVNMPRQIMRSTDGGLTWGLQSHSGDALPVAKFFVHPKQPDTLLGPNGNGAVTISTDQGKTWKAYGGAGLGPTNDKFGALAVDRAGYVYRAAAGGYTGPNDAKAEDGTVTFNSFDPATKKWAKPVTIPTVEGDMLWPWVTAGDDGRVAVAWLQREPKDKANFDIWVAATTSARGTTVRCANGSTRFVPPRWTVANATKGRFHRGAICQAGTGCNASTGDPGDRRIGDFFSVAYDKAGRIFVVGGATAGLGDQQRAISAPIFIAAESGPKLLKKPMRTRPTRPTCGLDPLC